MAPPIGGITRWAEMMKEELERKDINHQIINTSPKKRKIDGQSSIERMTGGFGSILKSSQTLVKQIHANHHSLIHVASSGSIAHIRDLVVMSIAKIFRAKTVLHLHHGRLPQIIDKFCLERFLLDMVMRTTDDLIVLDSESYAAALIRWNHLKIHRIGNPVNAPDLCPTKATKQNKIVYLGWIKPEKGIEILLDSWCRLSPKFPEWKLELVGGFSEPYKQSLIERFGNDNWKLAGEQPHQEAMRILSHSEILVLPSYSEGFPNVLLEAMALSKPVVATRVGGIPDMLTEGGGLLVSPGSTDDLYRSLSMLMEGKACRIEEGTRGRNSVLKNYSLSVIVCEYKKVWEQQRTREM